MSLSDKNTRLNLLMKEVSDNLVSIGKVFVHKDILAAWGDLVAAASLAGFDLAIASGFRSFERQLQIWDQKALGQRLLLDQNGNTLDAAELHPLDLMWAILTWSALPGASRHHWGTDIDVYDKRPVDQGYVLQLNQQETQGDGPMAPLHRWLDEYLATSETPFFRPYISEQPEGVAPDPWRLGIQTEPWHLSYAPLAMEYQQVCTQACLAEQWEIMEFALKDEVMDHISFIYDHYIWVPWSLYPWPHRP